MDERKDVTVPMPREMVDDVDGRLEYGDSRAAWIREAVRQRLEREEDEQGNRARASPTTAD